MRTHRSTLGLSSLLTCSLLALGACGDDGGGTGSGNASSGGQDTEAETDPAADSTQGPAETDSTDPPSTTTEDPTDDTLDSSTGNPPPGEVDAFRFTSMFVRDPHFFVLGLGVLCVDATDSTPTGDPSINEQFNAAIAGDDPENPDGNLDLNLMLLFRPLNQGDGATGTMDFANGVCPVPPTIECGLQDGTNLDSGTYVVMQEGTCLEPDPTHLSSDDYDPQPGTTTGPCFVSEPTDVTIQTTDFALPLSDALVSAQFSGDPTNDLVSGTMRGFLSMADANSIVLPADIQKQTGAMTIAELLPGGMNNCANHDDTDGDGWWMYVDFEASRIPSWTGP